MAATRLRPRPTPTRRRLLAVVLCAITAATLAACGRSGATASAAEKRTGHGLVIGWSQRSLAGSDWYKTLVQGGQDAAHSMGAKIDVLDANGSTIQQDEDVQTLVSRGADVVVINANDPIGVASALKTLKSDGIPAVAVNSNLDESLRGDVFCYVAENQVTTGARAGRLIAQRAVTKFGPHGRIKLLGVGGFPGDVLSELRYRGFLKGYREVMATHPGVRTTMLPFRYGHWLPDQALEPVRDAATANPDLNVVYSESDVMQSGVVQGLQEAGVWGNNMLEGSYDGGMNAIGEMVSNPHGPLQADASNVPYDQGRTAVKMALAAYRGDKSSCPSGTKYVRTTVVTPQNARHYYNPNLTHVQLESTK